MVPTLQLFYLYFLAWFDTCVSWCAYDIYRLLRNEHQLHSSNQQQLTIARNQPIQQPTYPPPIHPSTHPPPTHQPQQPASQEGAPPSQLNPGPGWWCNAATFRCAASGRSWYPGVQDSRIERAGFQSVRKYRMMVNDALTVMQIHVAPKARTFPKGVCIPITIPLSLPGPAQAVSRFSTLN